MRQTCSLGLARFRKSQRKEPEQEKEPAESGASQRRPELFLTRSFYDRTPLIMEGRAAVLLKRDRPSAKAFAPAGRNRPRIWNWFFRPDGKRAQAPRPASFHSLPKQDCIAGFTFSGLPPTSQNLRPDSLNQSRLSGELWHPLPPKVSTILQKKLNFTSFPNLATGFSMQVFNAVDGPTPVTAPIRIASIIV